MTKTMTTEDDHEDDTCEKMTMMKTTDLMYPLILPTLSMPWECLKMNGSVVHCVAGAVLTHDVTYTGFYF